jgi:hypothetical protein
MMVNQFSCTVLHASTSVAGTLCIVDLGVPTLGQMYKLHNFQNQTISPLQPGVWPSGKL